MSTAGCTRSVASRLVLIRHAKADYPPATADRDRPLAPRGRRDAKVGGVWLRDHAGQVLTGSVLALVSSATRTQQTWELVGRHLDVEAIVDPRLYAAPMDAVVEVISEHEADTVIVVGHNPTMHDMSLQLAGNDPHRLLPAIAWRFPTCTIAAIELDPDDPWGYRTGTALAVHTPRA